MSYDHLIWWTPKKITCVRDPGFVYRLRLYPYYQGFFAQGVHDGETPDSQKPLSGWMWYVTFLLSMGKSARKTAKLWIQDSPDAWSLDHEMEKKDEGEKCTALSVERWSYSCVHMSRYVCFWTWVGTVSRSYSQGQPFFSMWQKIDLYACWEERALQKYRAQVCKVFVVCFFHMAKSPSWCTTSNPKCDVGDGEKKKN